MRILIFTNHFSPESFRINDIAFEMAARGHKVKVVTGIPDYPEGKFHKGYSLFRKRFTIGNGVEVIRFPIVPRGNGRSFRMMANYASGVLSGWCYGLWQGLFHEFDCVFVHDTSPAFICLPAQLAACIRHVPVYHWVLDLWPDSLVVAGITGGWIYNMMGRMMRRVFSRDTKVLVSSKSIGRLIVERGCMESKIFYLPNWSEQVESNGASEIPEMPQGFIILFAGNIGEAQNMEVLLNAALKTSDRKDIHWVFVGDGRKKLWAESFVREHSISDTVHFTGRYPISSMPAIFEKADVMLLSLVDTSVFNMTVPAKLQAYMAAGKPVFAVMNGEGARIVTEAECGWTAEPSDADKIAEVATTIASTPDDVLKKAGVAAKSYYNNHFDRSLCLDRLFQLLSGNE